jgi:hypothetical protein
MKYQVTNLETDLVLYTCSSWDEAFHYAKRVSLMNAFTVGIVMGSGLKVVA